MTRFNSIPTGLGHVMLIYGLIPPMAGRNRVKNTILQKKFHPIVSTQPSQLSLVASPGPRIPKEPFNRQIRASLLSESLYAFALDLSQRLRPRPNLIVEWNNISFIITIDYHS